MKKIAVIGGGITGLVAAYELQRRGASVQLFEAGDRCGGPMHTISRDGFLVESGPNTIVDKSGDVHRLIANLGIEKKIVSPNPSAKKRYIVRDGKLLPVPLSPQAFITTPLFSLSAKLRLLQEPFISRYNGAAEESISEFVRRRLGIEFLEYAVDPFVSGVYAGDTDALSMQRSFKDIYALEEKYGSILKGRIAKAKAAKAQKKSELTMFSFDNGLQVLIDAFIHTLSPAIHYQTSIDAIINATGKWQLQSATGSFNEFDVVISTIPAYQFAKIVIGHNDRTQRFEQLNEISYPPVTSLSLGFRRTDITHPLDGFGMLVPSKERMNILGTLFVSSLFDGRAPKDHTLLTTFIGGARTPELALLDDEKLLSIVTADLNRLLGVNGKPIFIHRSKFTKAIPQYNLGYEKYLILLDTIESTHPGLFIRGNFRTGISIPDCIKSATEIANRAMNRM